MTDFSNSAVEEKFASYPQATRKRLLELREKVFEAATGLDNCGTVMEALKWGQPSFLTERPKSGSTIRLDAVNESGDAAFYFHCQSGLIAEFRERYPDVFEFQGNRAILLRAGRKVPSKALKHCLSLALTHHSRKRRTK